jgi:hypothetical protein
MSSPRALAAFLVGSFLTVHAALFAVARADYADTGLVTLEAFFRGTQGRDSWDPMAHAYFHATTPHAKDKPFYWRTAFSPQVVRKGYQYPPSALLVVSVLDRAFGAAWPRVIRAITWAMVPLTAACVWALARALLRARGAGDGGWWLAGVCAFATLNFYPVMRAYANGQMQTWLNAAFAAALWCWVTRRRPAAGALLALCCAVKPQLGLFLLWGALRRQWGFVGTFLATGLAVLVVSLAVYGWEPHVGYLGMLRFLGERGEAFFPNQSVNGLLQRWLFNGDVLSWRQPWVEHFPPYDARIFWATVASSIVLIAAALAAPVAESEHGGALDFSVMGLVATMASPIAWEHHYGVVLPMFAVAWIAFRDAPPGPRRLLALAYVLIGTCFWVTRRLYDSRWNVLESYLFFGAVVLLGLLLWRRARAGADPGGAALA